MRPLGHADPDDSSSVAVVSRRESAAALVHPVRRKVLDALKDAGSATTVAERLKLPRQVVNYHVRALEKAGLVEEVERRQRRGLEERIVRATASYYLVSPEALSGKGGARAADGRDVRDRFSASYQVAVAARTIREVAALGELASKAGKRLTTMSLDSEVTFASPADREAFARDFLNAITQVIARYNAPPSKNARTYRVFAGAHPKYFEQEKK